MKRIIDCIIAALCLVIFSPVCLVIALAIRMEDGLPVIYKQERIGLHGKPFFIYKFRSMRVDAEKDGPDLLEVSGDPRLTKVGKFCEHITSMSCPSFGMSSSETWRSSVLVRSASSTSTKSWSMMPAIRISTRFVRG